MNTPLQTLTYSSAIFNVGNIEDAKRIILTPEVGLSSDERWQNEHLYLLRLMKLGAELPAGGLLSEDSWVLDYGCGIGRLSKELIRLYDCNVIGVDISVNMRALATAYVESPKFTAVSPDMLNSLALQGIRFDFALAVWVIQHCFAPQGDLKLIESVLRKGGQFFVVNEKLRAVPTLEGRWTNDGIDVRVLLDELFKLVSEGSMDPEVVTQAVSDRTFWAIYKK